MKDRIIDTYGVIGSIEGTSKKLGISSHAVKKTLIAEGLISNHLSAEIETLRERGKSDKEIMEELHISGNVLNMNSPYKRGSYLDDDKTENAIRIAEWRKRKREI